MALVQPTDRRELQNVALFGAVAIGNFQKFRELWTTECPFGKKLLCYAIIFNQKEIIFFLLSQGVEWEWNVENEQEICPCIDCNKENSDAWGLVGRLPFDHPEESDTKDIVDRFHELKPYPNYEEMARYAGWVTVDGPIETINPLEPSPAEKVRMARLFEEAWDEEEKKEIVLLVEKYPMSMKEMIIWALRSRNSRALTNLLYFGCSIPIQAFQEILCDKPSNFFKRNENPEKIIKVLLSRKVPVKSEDLLSAFESGEERIFELLRASFKEDLPHFTTSIDESTPEKYGLIALGLIA